MKIKRGVEINDFACEWSDVFTEEQLDVEKVKTQLEEDCIKLGFKDDGGKALLEEIDESFETQEELFWMLEFVEDENAIGNAILTKYHECLNDHSFEENISWFKHFFDRLKFMTFYYADMFEGTPYSFKLISDSLEGGNEQFWQEFTLDRNGNAIFKKIVPSINIEKPQQEDAYIIPKEKAKKILKEVVTALNQEVQSQELHTEMNNWEITVRNTKQEEYMFMGNFRKALFLNGIDLSHEIRKAIDENDLMLFDGTGDMVATNETIETVVLEYHHVQDLQDQLSHEWYHVDVNEKLAIDCSADLITLETRFSDESYVRHQYHVPSSVEIILDEFTADSLFKDKYKRPNNIVPLPNQEFNYKLTVTYGSSKPMVMEGEYDMFGLPMDFPKFMESLNDFFQYYGLGECMKPNVYGRKRRKANQFIYLSVAFEEDTEDTYYYLCDDDSVEVGDIIVVPSGEENELKLARVMDVDYFESSIVPYPLEKTKKMIRKATLEDFDQGE